MPNLQLTASVTPGGAVLRDTPLTVSADEPLDPRSARGAITLFGQRAQVVLSDDGRTATVLPVGGLPAGYHRLLVGEVLGADGERAGNPLEVPFVAVDSNAALPAGLRVDNYARIRVEEFTTTRLPLDQHPEGAFLDLVKATVIETGEPVELAFDERGDAADAEEILTGLARRRAERFQGLDEALYARLERAEPGERVPVAVWGRLPEEPERPDKPSEEPVREPPPAELRAAEVARAVSARLRRIVAAEFGDGDATADEAAPVVYATLDADRARELARHDAVAGVLLHETDGVDDLADSIAVAHSGTVHTTLGLTGRGVRVAVWELGPDDEQHLNIAARYTSRPSTSSHSRLTHAIISNTEPDRPHGHAPDAILHSANSYDLDALRWAVRDRGVTVVSQSFHRSSEQTSSGLSFDDIYKDWLVLHWPYPTILQAAGNFDTSERGGADEFVNHKGFNSLAVANHNDSASAISGDSAFRNPASRHSDRELPEIAANGTAVTAAGRTGSGTSFAAPAVAGVAALLQQREPTLRSWPEGGRAILLASADRNPSGSTWGRDVRSGVDGSDGSGALNALSAARIAQSRRFRNAPATRRGWDVGTLRSSDFNDVRLSTFAYRVSVPRTILGPTVKVALAWNSEVGELFGIYPFSSTLTVDFDLLVTDAAGNLAGSSSTWDNSYEIVEFAAARGTTYEIRIRRWSGTAATWFGLAWTVTGPEILPALPDGEAIR
ncbi:S8 family serine peptidase [Frankia sp. Mgl5]|uniref:S8 family serine peptidase n=1 Tax=Frankia sp. Mgl5 TaxID=2933793 RepID=UPI00200F5FC2|nr:S8 family serine peptidase [Frankia sp. Mgl5]MCK9931115.1 S8 family serine peptidase [Frankia sp. Mgl5]